MDLISSLYAILQRRSMLMRNFRPMTSNKTTAGDDMTAPDPARSTWALSQPVRALALGCHSSSAGLVRGELLCEGPEDREVAVGA